MTRKPATTFVRTSATDPGLPKISVGNAIANLTARLRSEVGQRHEHSLLETDLCRYDRLDLEERSETLRAALQPDPWLGPNLTGRRPQTRLEFELDGLIAQMPSGAAGGVDRSDPAVTCETYAQALGDLPAWASLKAIGLALRGHIGKWLPGPGELHALAANQLSPVLAELESIETILHARIERLDDSAKAEARQQGLDEVMGHLARATRVLAAVVPRNVVVGAEAVR